MVWMCGTEVKMKQVIALCIALVLTLMTGLTASGQNELAATLEVLSAGVTVQRVNTANPIPTTVEAIVGVGDVIRTDATGRARITFFADGTDTELLPNTEYRITEFNGDETQFDLTVEVILGQTLQRLQRILDSNSNYKILTPGMELAARGTVFAVRVEDSGRAAMLVTEGLVQASKEAASADVAAEFGIRAAVDGALSDVVRAKTFDELDAGIDGCTVGIETVDDTRLNVRVGPSVEAPRAGTIAASEVTLVYGVVDTSDWYRISFRGGFGWILASQLKIVGACAGLRVFESGQMEDPTLYEYVGDPLEIDMQPTLPAAPETEDESETGETSP